MLVKALPDTLPESFFVGFPATAAAICGGENLSQAGIVTPTKRYFDCQQPACKRPILCFRPYQHPVSGLAIHVEISQRFKAVDKVGILRDFGMKELRVPILQSARFLDGGPQGFRQRHSWTILVTAK